MTLIAFQMQLKAPDYENYPSYLYGESQYYGDLSSEVFKYYAFTICMGGFGIISIVLAY